MRNILHAGRPAGNHDPARHNLRLRPWQRGLALLLAAVIATSPVAARGPGRPGIDALVDPPDILPVPTTAANANLAYALDPTQAIPGSPLLPGLTVDSVGDQPLTVSVDAITGAPTGMVLGKPLVSSSGEWMVPLQASHPMRPSTASRQRPASTATWA